MINIAALALLVSSLAAAGLLSPPPPASTIREGHRLIVLEYERHIPSQSPPPTNLINEEAKEKFHEAPAHLPNLGQGLSTPEKDSARSAKDLICDAYGSCKEKISGVFHKGKENIVRKASDIEETTKENVKHAEDQNVRDAAHSTAGDLICDAYGTCKEKISHVSHKGKEKIAQKASGIEENVKEAVKSTTEVTMEAGQDLVGNISRDARIAVNRAEDAATLLGRNLSDMISRAKHASLNVENMRVFAAMVHLLGFAVAYGTSVWVTFVSSYVLGVSLPRQQFGIVQSKVYPLYFRAVAIGVGIAGLGQFYERERVVGVERVQGYNLLGCLGLVLVNMLCLEPKATKAMLEMMKMEKEEGRGKDICDVLESEPVMTSSTATAATATTTPTATTTIRVTRATMSMDQEAIKSRVVKLNKKLKKLNTYSSFVNILSLMSLTWHLVHLARRLNMSSCTC